jgi:N-acetylglutamate synthase-like GNAT family acetyltransferase
MTYAPELEDACFVDAPASLPAGVAAGQLRRPTLQDVPAITAFLADAARAGRILPRSARAVAERLRDTVVVHRGTELVGVGSLSLVDLHLAEITLAVGADAAVQGALVLALLRDARALGAGRVFATTDEPAACLAAGFERVSLESIPEKRDRQCLRCANAPRCRKTAVAIDLGAEA